MQQKEALPTSGRTFVALVEARDAVGQCGEESIVDGPALAERVRPVGKEGEVEMAFGIGQIVHLEPLELLLDISPVRDQRGDDDHGSKLWGHAAGEFELGEQRRWNENRNQAMNEGHCDIRGGHEPEESQEDEAPETCPSAPCKEQRHEEQEGGEESDSSQVTGGREGAYGAAKPDSQGNAKTQAPLQSPAP